MSHNINIAKRLDIVVKYLFIKAYINNKDLTFYKDLYKKHIKLQSGWIEDHKKHVDDFETEFITLIKSIQQNGFNKKYPIIINTHWDILNWAHRYACCMFFNIQPNIIVDNTLEWIDWWYPWFQKNSFTSDQLAIILWGYTQLINDYTIIISWPKIKNVSYDILPNIVGNIQLDLKSKKAFKEFVYDIYSHDYNTKINIWAVEKANYLANIWTQVEIYVLAISTKDFHKKKENIRKKLIESTGITDISKAGYYTIHSSDTKSESSYLRNILLNSNNIFQLQNRNFSERKQFLNRLEYLEDYLKKNKIWKEEICLVGSSSMEIFNLDKTSDIDFIMSRYTDTWIVKVHSEIDHLDYRYSKKYSNSEIVSNNNYHFFFRWFKCINLDILAEIKLCGTRKKDITQAKIIMKFLEENKESQSDFLHKLIIESKYLQQRVLIKWLKISIYITKKIHIYKPVSYLWRRYILKRNWK